MADFGYPDPGSRRGFPPIIGTSRAAPNSPDRPPKVVAISAPILLSAQGLRLHQPALGPLDLHLAAGEITLLAGPSGCGKSRLLRTLADLDRATAGSLTLEGEDMSAMGPPAYRSRVAYLPATPQLGPATVRALLERVASFRYRRTLSDPQEGLQRLGLPGSILGRSAEELSTGETVRVALALLLSGDARVLLLDEPTGALDPPSARAVEAWVRERVAGGAAVLWVTHDPDQAARMGDALLTLEDGDLTGPERDPARFADRVRRLDPEAAGSSGGSPHAR